MECVTCACVWLGAGCEVLGESGYLDWVWALPILEEHGEGGICVCVFCCGGVGDVGGKWVGGLGQGLRGWGGVMSVCVVSLDSPC